jgi:hypothetical protein
MHFVQSTVEGAVRLQVATIRAAKEALELLAATIDIGGINCPHQI